MTTPAERPPEFVEAVDELHRALWALATGRADDARGTLAAMTDYAGLVLQFLDARERVQRASTVRVAPPAGRPTVREPAARASPGRRNPARGRDSGPTARRDGGG